MIRKWVLIIGARPQFIKASILCKSISDYNLCSEDKIDLKIIHTGQHYDNAMSEVFFDELNIPAPEINLQCIDKDVDFMKDSIIKAIKAEQIEKIIVFGDTNSTLAGALAAEQLQIPLAHIEAGLRSYNPKMKEEYNRIETDKRSKWLFTPTSTAIKNLEKEGITQGVYNVGDIMLDATLYFGGVSDKKSNMLEQLGLKQKEYYFTTIHRAENTDNKDILKDIFLSLAEISKTKTIVLPLHPRTKKEIQNNKEVLEIVSKEDNIKIIDPLGYLDTLALEKNAKMIITDSGGIQKEAYFHKVPCITLREETEWVETVEADSNIICGHDVYKIANAINHNFSMKPISEYGNGDTSKKIIEILINE